LQNRTGDPKSRSSFYTGETTVYCKKTRIKIYKGPDFLNCCFKTYRGPKAFQRHFSEWRHAHGMRCLGIPNTAHFANVTEIEDALARKFFVLFWKFHLFLKKKSFFNMYFYLLLFFSKNSFVSVYFYFLIIIFFIYIFSNKFSVSRTKIFYLCLIGKIGNYSFLLDGFTIRL